MINYIENSDIDDELVLDEIIENKHEPGKSNLKNCKNIVSEDYGIYKKNTNALQLLIPDTRIPDESKEELINTYKNNPKTLQEAKEKIKKSLPRILKAKCPYCLISAHSTFDHYIDKSHYPEYALLSSNLIPACAECNSLKGSTVCDNQGNRLYINFIYDKLPEYPFLKYKISIEDGNVVLEDIVLEFKDDDPVNVIIKHHFEKLKLIRRLKNQFDVAISTIFEEFQQYEFNEKQIKDLLTKKLFAWEKTKGINNWETCILREIISSEVIVKYLSNC